MFTKIAKDERLMAIAQGASATLPTLDSSESAGEHSNCSGSSPKTGADLGCSWSLPTSCKMRKMDLDLHVSQQTSVTHD